MNVIGIIPARYASTRFPGKPLALINGKTMVERVYTQASQAQGLTKVVIATDDARIESVVKSFGGEAIMTSPTHQTGTERSAEVVSKLSEAYDVAINIQGDEPFINPHQIEEVAACFTHPEVQIATLIKEIQYTEELTNPNVVKAVVNNKGLALYFSRSPIPHLRDHDESRWVNQHTYYKHVGIYGYRIAVLNELVKLFPTPLEKAESLEQLRWLENGYTITTRVTTYSTIAIDTPEDLEKALKESKVI